jgi:phosphatidylglycerol:prolipoprotein diacylglycerol transferase
MNTASSWFATASSARLLETVREPDAHMPEALRGVVTMGMLLSIPMIR